MQIDIATFQDMRDIWYWRNDPHTRAMSITTEEIEWEKHTGWFERLLSCPNSILLVGSLDGKKIGMCKFDIDRNTQSAYISINLNPMMRGKKLSPLLLQSAIHFFYGHYRFELLAKIKNQNTPSILCFTKCGFILKYQDENYQYYSLNFSSDTAD